MGLLPEHLQDLQKSGLRPETISEMRCRSILREGVKAHLGFGYSDIQSLLCLPYNNGSGFHRDKVFPVTLKDSEGRSLKYLQPPKTPPCLYILPSIEQALTDISRTIVFVEGEKSAASVVQIGKLAVGVGGVWSWMQGGDPISDLQKIPLLGRSVQLCFDSDTWIKFELQKPVYAFAKYLQGRGASPISLIVLPQFVDGIEGGKIGIDDFLRVRPDGYSSLTSVPFSRIEKSNSLQGWYKAWILKQQEERRKKEEEADAKKNKAQVGISDFEPWTDPVNGDAVLSETVNQVQRFLVVTDEQAIAIALWVFHAHGIDAADVSPFLTFESPLPECGKSTAQALIGRLTPRSIATSNISPAALFRLIDRYCPTLLIDEGDTFVKLSEDMRGILNASHFRNSAFVVRTVGDSFEPKIFSTWSPKVVALIGSLPPTLTSRSIIILMKRKKSNQVTERFSPQKKYPELEVLGRKIARWIKDSLPTLKRLSPEIPPALGNNRAVDNWITLIGIADSIGGGWPIKARDAALALSGIEVEEPLNVELLKDIQSLFYPPSSESPEPSILDVGKVFSETLVEALVNLAHRPWPTYRRGKPITQNTLARFLRDFGIRPRDIRIADKVAKGFRAEWFEDVFSRYLVLRNYEPLQGQQSNKTEDFPPLLEVLQEEGVAVDKVSVSTRKDLDVAGVAVQRAEKEGWEKIDGD